MKSSANFRKRSKRSRGIRRRAVALAALLVLVAAIVWLVHALLTRVNAPVDTYAAPAAAKPATTPQPQPWSDADRARLRDALDGAFAPALSGADRWSLAVNAADGTSLFDNGADRAATPASVQKLIVAATSLQILGANYRYHTLFAARSPIGSDGALQGDLWLIGSGDPTLRDGDLRRGIDTLARAGLQRIDGGGVAIDATGLRGPELNPHWAPDDAEEDYGAPTSAVSLDGDTVEFDVTGTTPGQPANVAIVPQSDAVQTSGEIATSSAGADSDVTIAAAATPNSFRMTGSIPAGAHERYWLPISGVAAYVGAVVDRMLAQRGIATARPATQSIAPLDTIVLWDRRSPSLRSIEEHMLFHSDNHFAEQLLRTVGGEATGEASDEQGILTERRFLSERGIPTPELHLVDGSGLSAENRIAASTLVGILSDAELRGGDASLYMLLPQGGRQGTLRYYDFTTALGRVRAKSGHIGGVAALAGYVNTFHHGRVAFAFLIDGSPGNPDAAIVRAVDRLVEF